MLSARCALAIFRYPVRCAVATSHFSASVYRGHIASLTDLKRQVVLITGATAGIGAACAMRLAEEGCKLVLVGRRKDRLDIIKKEILSFYPHTHIHTVSLSVTDYDAVAALPTTLPPEFRDVDILVNNAGIALGTPTVDQNRLEDAKQVMDTNVLGTIALCSAFIPGMKKRNRGHIVNMGSISGHFASTTGSVYNASKYAVHGFTSAARHDLAATPLRVTHISPGMVSNTEFSHLRFKDENKVAALYDNITALNPEDVADSVIYAVTRPRHVQVADIIVYCTNQSGPRDLARVGTSLGATSK
ncbi:SDR family NAD(P)-dependent oxidoreductase [archaeon]|nr:MAG: SDR family NAD(P)-dependent oxidoreductase [archaeon]